MRIQRTPEFFHAHADIKTLIDATMTPLQGAIDPRAVATSDVAASVRDRMRRDLAAAQERVADLLDADQAFVSMARGETFAIFANAGDKAPVAYALLVQGEISETGDIAGVLRVYNRGGRLLDERFAADGG